MGFKKINSSKRDNLNVYAPNNSVQICEVKLIELQGEIYESIIINETSAPFFQ